MTPHLVRVLRTPSSERFLIQPRPGEDAAALDLHYLPDGRVAGTLILFEEGAFRDSDVPGLLEHIDRVLLPEVSFDQHNLSFTVVRGRIVGSYESQQAGPGEGPR